MVRVLTLEPQKNLSLPGPLRHLYPLERGPSLCCSTFKGTYMYVVGALMLLVLLLLIVAVLPAPLTRPRN